MKAATWAAGIAIACGLAVLAVYWVVFVLAALGDDSVPVLVKIAVLAVLAGAAALLAVVVVQRLRDRKDENLEEVEY